MANNGFTLEVPGAQIYYEKEGTGPLLILIPGANGDNTIFKPIRQFLKNNYTVVTYDRRGFSLSKLTADQDFSQKLNNDADDVRRLVEHLSDEPATILGSSSGAIVALTVLVNHPTYVRTLVAHEPPLFKLLPDAPKWNDFLNDVYDTYKKSGVEVGMKLFLGQIACDTDAKFMESAGHASRGEHALRNATYFFEREFVYGKTDIDVDALRRYADRLVLVIGDDSRDHVPAWPNGVLAKMLNKRLFQVPGGHLGYLTRAEEFARALLKILGDSKL